jgi:hypothetical protein
MHTWRETERGRQLQIEQYMTCTNLSGSNLTNSYVLRTYRRLQINKITNNQKNDISSVVKKQPLAQRGFDDTRLTIIKRLNAKTSLTTEIFEYTLIIRSRLYVTLSFQKEVCIKCFFPTRSDQSP